MGSANILHIGSCGFPSRAQHAKALSIDSVLVRFKKPSFGVVCRLRTNLTPMFLLENLRSISK